MQPRCPEKIFMFYFCLSKHCTCLCACACVCVCNFLLIGKHFGQVRKACQLVSLSVAQFASLELYKQHKWMTDLASTNYYLLYLLCIEVSSSYSIVCVCVRQRKTQIMWKQKGVFVGSFPCLIRSVFWYDTLEASGKLIWNS